MSKKGINWLLIIAVVGSIIFIAKYFYNKRNAEPGVDLSKEFYEIGAVLPLTGDVAVYGNNTKKGIDLAVQKINGKGGVKGKKIKIIYEDSKADPKTGASAITKLITADKIQVVIDNSVSSVALAMEPIATKNNIVLLSTGSTSPKLSGISKYFFRIWNSDDLEGRVAANFSSDSLDILNISVLYINNDYGVGLSNVFEKQIIKRGGVVNEKIAFEQNSKNIKTQIAKAINASVIYIVGYTNENALIINNLKEIGYKGVVLGTVTMQDEKIIELSKTAAEGVIYPYPEDPDPNQQVVSDFNSSYRGVYNEKPGITSDVGFDAV